MFDSASPQEKNYLVKIIYWNKINLYIEIKNARSQYVDAIWQGGKFSFFVFFPWPECLNVPTPVSRKCSSGASLRNLMNWNDPDEVGWWWVLVLSGMITN